MHDDITIIIPAFDEERRLPATLDRLIAELPDCIDGKWEIVVSDDGSRDNTVGVVSARSSAGPVRLVPSEAHRGKGAALVEGVRASMTPLVVFLDADLPVSVTTIGAMVTECSLRPSIDLLVGSRRVPGAAWDPPQPTIRRWGGRGFLMASRTLGYRTTSDPQCGVKVLRRDRVADLLSSVVSQGFAFDIELLARAERQGLVVDEMPVVWSHVAGSSLRPTRDAVVTLVELSRLRRLLRAGGQAGACGSFSA